MNAAGFFEPGPPEVLKIVELPEPIVGKGEVRIRVHAAAVSPTDTLTRSGKRPEALEGPPPYVVGMDAAGVLDLIGEGVETDLQIGEHVMAFVSAHGAHGAYSQYITVPAQSVVRTPVNAGDIEAATLPMNGLTARQALDVLALPSGASLVVTGAAGIVGRYAIQLAKADGLRVIADAAPRDEALVASVGADIVVPRGPELASSVRALVPEGVDGVVDAALMNELVEPMVRDGGAIATVRGFVGETVRNISYRPVSVRTYAKERGKLDRLRQQVESGAITLLVASVFPAAQAAQAHRLLEAGGTRGRIVLEL